MDPVVLTSLIISIGSLLTSIITHVKHSSCLYHCIDFDTYNPNEIVHEQSQIINQPK